jgi:outer membrane protein assembly factor BamB
LNTLKLLISGLLAVSAVASRAQVIEPTPLWSVDSGPAVCSVIPIGSASQCSGFLISHADGTIGRYTPLGKLQSSCKMDLPTDSPPLIVRMDNSSDLAVISADCQGSIYRFTLDGKRIWKRTFTGKYRDFRVPVSAQMYGSAGGTQALFSDSRGALRAFDALGNLRLELHASRYRVSSPAAGEIAPGKMGIIYGTETGDVDCVSPQGSLIWSRHIGGGFGRALPLMVPGAHPMVLMARGFVDKEPALCALDAANGKLLWKAACASQVYHNIVFASLKRAEGPSVLFGDKHTYLNCVDVNGRTRWKTRLEGKGLFFTPTIADLDGTGDATIFAEVRGMGSSGSSLYVLDSSGKLLQGIPLPGGGASAPALVKFAGEPELKLLTVTGGKICCFQVKQGANAKIVWSGLRNAPASPGCLSGIYPSHTAAPMAAVQTAFTSSDSGFLKAANGSAANCPLPVPQRASYTVQDGAVFRSIVTSDVKASQLQLPMDQMRLWFNTKGKYSGTISVVDARGSVFSTPYVLAARGAIQRAHDRVAHVERLIAAARPSVAGRALLNLLSRRLAADLKSAGDSGDALRLRDVEQRALCLEKICAFPEIAAPNMQDLRVRKLTNPWPSHSELDLLTDTAAASPEISTTLPGNAFASEALSITNLSTQTKHVTAIVTGAEQSAELQVRACVTIVPTASGIPTQDPLVPMTAGRAITLEPGQTGKLWLTFCSRGLSVNDHKVNLLLGDTASPLAPFQCTASLRVLPLSLPQKQTFRHVNWLYLASIADPYLREKTANDALEHGTNVFNIPACSVQADELGLIKSTESEAHDALVKLLEGRAEFLVDGTVGVSIPAGASDSVRTRAFQNALHWYAAHMRDLGCDYSDYAFYITDEPGLSGADKAFDDFAATIHQVKAADPKLRIFCNPAGGAHADVLAPIASEVDIWCPDMHLVKTQPDELAAMFKSRGEYWHYEAPADQRSLDPLGFYRMQPWTAFKYGMTGGGYWVYSSASDWLEDPQRSGEYGAVYASPDGPIDTRRFEATREGIQDFELLTMLQTLASQQSGQGNAGTLLKEAVEFVTAGQQNATDITRQAAPFCPDYWEWMHWRQKIVDALLAAQH